MIRPRSPQCGFSLIELMVALTIGLFLTGAIISVYLVQTRMVKSSSAQAGIQNAENALAALVTPLVRSAGFDGCATMTQSISNLVPGGPAPLGGFTTTPRFLAGYEAVNTGATGSFVVAASNPANDNTAANWSPALDATLTGLTQKGSDVLVVMGAVPGASPVGVTTIANAGTTLVLQDASGRSSGELAMVSDCVKSSIFKVTAVAGNTLTHTVGVLATDNSLAALALNYQPGAQFVPLQVSALFIGRGQGDQSTLMLATYVAGAWNVQPLVPGIDAMQLLYGIGTGGIVAQYVTAAAVPDWTKVYAVRLGVLVQGQLGSGGAGGSGTQQFSVLGTTVTVPADGRLRHVYEMLINVRNAS